MVAFVVALALALFGNLAASTVSVASPLAKVLLWVAVGVLVAASIVLEFIHRRVRSGDEGTDLVSVADRLASAVQSRIRREEEHRKVTDPVPLPVRWHPADDSLIDHWANICGTPVGQASGAVALSGRIDQVAEVYRRIPSGRLVILGPAGCGKTVLAARLTAELLIAREPTDPVAFLASIGSWNPAESFRDWLARQLIQDHPGLSRACLGYPSLAVALIDQRRVVPILDGLDEISPGLHQAALTGLNEVASMPMVLTSRPEQFAYAVGQVDVLTAAAGITVDPLTLEDLTQYLPRTTRPRSSEHAGDGGWQPVLAAMFADPHGCGARLVEALSNPLMVYLARTIYSDPPARDPAELLDAIRFPAATAVADHLLAGWLSAVYPDRSVRGANFSEASARRWLTYLARHLRKLDTNDLAWWRIRDTVPRAIRILLLGLGAWLAIGIVFSVASIYVAGFLGFFVAFIFGPVAGLPAKGPTPQGARLRLLSQLRPLRDGITAGLIVGLLIGLAAGLLDDAPTGIGYGLASGAVIGVAVWLTNALESPVDLAVAVGVTDSLRRDRKNCLARWLLLGSAIGVAAGVVVAVPIAVAGDRSEAMVMGGFVALIIGPLFGVTRGLIGAWGQWLVLARCWLPMTGRLPWRFNAFLADAYQRGVLRQSGAFYQFRHERLKDQLIDTANLAPSRSR